MQRAVRDACREAGVELRRADSIFRSGVIVDQIREAMADADLIIAVCTGTNANVFYELGMAEAMGHQPILIAPDARHLPFDKAHCRCHMYGGKRLTTGTCARVSSGRSRRRWRTAAPDARSPAALHGSRALPQAVRSLSHAARRTRMRDGDGEAEREASRWSAACRTAGARPRRPRGAT